MKKTPQWFLDAITAIKAARLGPEISFSANALASIVLFIEQSETPPDREWLREQLAELGCNWEDTGG